MKVKDKVAVVTGAADGIGKELALVFAMEGAKVIVADIQDKGIAVVETIRKSGGQSQFVQCDVGKDSDVQQLFQQTLSYYGQVDILVNNAAVAIGGTITEFTEELWNKVINTNLSSVFRCSKYAIRQMKLQNGGGSIVNMASAQAHVGFDEWTAYAASKGGIIAMTQQLAVEFAPYQIRVNSISPGTINTSMLERRLVDEGQHLLEVWSNMHPIGRIGNPSEVANAVIFLASSESSFITGVDLKVDGGLTLRP